LGTRTSSSFDFFLTIRKFGNSITFSTKIIKINYSTVIVITLFDFIIMLIA
jgi:hypothetical protein